MKTELKLNKNIKLSKTQLHYYNKLSSKDKQKYLLSKLGVKFGVPMKVDKLHNYKIDKLCQKGRNSILRQFREITNCSSCAEHKPINGLKGSFWVGVEIECNIPDYIGECTECGGTSEVTCYDCGGNGCEECGGYGEINCLECDSGSMGFNYLRDKIKQAGIRRASVRRDASLCSVCGGVEITLLFNAARSYEPLRRLCDLLGDLDAEIDSDCGLHVHLDMKDRTKRQVMYMSKKIEKYIIPLSLMVPASRRDNRYCRLKAGDIDKHNDRYNAINTDSWRKHKTIEIRLHSGSTNFKKIKNWIELLRKIVNKPGPKVKLNETNEMIRHLGIKYPLARYIKQREKKHV